MVVQHELQELLGILLICIILLFISFDKLIIFISESISIHLLGATTLRIVARRRCDKLHGQVFGWRNLLIYVRSCLSMLCFVIYSSALSELLKIFGNPFGLLGCISVLTILRSFMQSYLF